MNLHGDEIKIGDRVFDISSNRGYGEVTSIYDTTFEVKYQRYKIHYDEEGIQSNRDWTTLFWTRPLIVKPNKNESSWSKKQFLVEKVLEVIEELKGM